MHGKRKIDKILDVRGLPCPTPTVMAGKTLREMETGMTLRVISNDVTTKESITALCVDEGYRLLSTDEKNGIITFVIRT